MALFNELDIFKTAYDLTLHIFRFYEKMPRTYRYTIGERMSKDALELLLDIYKANSFKEERVSHLQDAQTYTEEVRLLLRISKDLQLLATSRFMVYSEMIESISKQLYRWKEATIQALPAYLKEQMTRPKSPPPSKQGDLF
jgi:four helix bundle protein